MESLLLDSQILLWAVTGDKKLGKAAARLIQTTPVVYVSTLSLFELIIKNASGGLKLPSEPEQAIEQEGLVLLDLTPNQLQNFRIFHSGNTDPFDNALLTIAETKHLRFLTADAAILHLQSTYPWIINGS